MAETLTRPVQVFLDTQRLIQAQPSGTRGPNRDFYANNNSGFRRHKKRIRQQLADASNAMRTDHDPAGFVMVQMRDEGLAKSYRPLSALFTVPHQFALVGGAGIGQMYFQATPEALDHLSELIERKAEIEPKLVQNEETGLIEQRVSAVRSELGAIQEIRVPTPADRLAFSARDAVSWLEQENVIGGYIVELFRPDLHVTPEAVQRMVMRFDQKLNALGPITAIPFGSRSRKGIETTVTLSVNLRANGRSSISLPLLSEDDDDDEVPILHQSGRRKQDRSLSRHQALLDLLSHEPLVRRIELPLRLEASPSDAQSLGVPAEISVPKRNQSYPVVGIVDGGVADISQLSPWRAGTAGLIPPSDRDNEHGSFIAGLLAGAGSLNPLIADHLEPTPCRFFDIDVLPRRGLLGRYYQTPDEFFDQLETQVAAAKAEAGVRIFNMSLGAPGIRQGLGYSSFAAHLDRIAREHDVIFVVSAGNLRGLEARPEWPPSPQHALEMLASRGSIDERITAPAEHLYGLTVGAINPPIVDGLVAGAPAAYTRRGPGPGGARKPELAHMGGASRAGNSSGLFSLERTAFSSMGVAQATQLPLSRLPLHLSITA